MEEKEVDLRDYINMVKKRWKIILIIFLVFTIGSAVVSFLLPRIYESTAMIKIGKMRNMDLENPSTVIEIFRTKPMVEKVAQELNIPAAHGQLGKLISKIRMREKSGLLEIKGRGETPEEALTLVNAAATAVLERHEEIFEQAKLILEEYLASGKQRLDEMEKEINILQKKIDELEATNSEAQALVAQGYMESLERIRDRYEQLEVELRQKKMEESYGTVSTELVIPPTTPEKPIAPKKKQNVLVAGILGLFVGIVSAAIVEYFEKPPAVY